MSIVSLVIAPSLAQMSGSAVGQYEDPTESIEEAATRGDNFMVSRDGGLKRAEVDPDDIDAETEYQTLVEWLKKEGVVIDKDHPLVVRGGHAYINDQPIEPTLEVKYAHLINEITRVQKNKQRLNR